MKKSLLLLMIMLSNISFASLSNEDIISINTPDTQITSKVKAINNIRLKIKARYGLDIRVNADQRYSEKNELEALELGLTNMVIISSNSLVEKYELKDLDVFNIPFIFNGLNEFNKFNNSLVSEELLRQINQKNKNIYGLTFWAKDYKHIQSNNSINNYVDIQNKLFVLSNSNVNTITKLVINPGNQTKFSLDDIKDNDINKNIIYSTMLSLSEFEKYKFANYNKNILLTYHGLDIDVVIINKRWFNRLSTEVQNGIVEIIKQSGIDQQKFMLEDNQKSINNLKDKGTSIIPISIEERNTFKKQMAPVHRYYYDYINKDILIKIYNLFK